MSLENAVQFLFIYPTKLAHRSLESYPSLHFVWSDACIVTACTIVILNPWLIILQISNSSEIIWIYIYPSHPHISPGPILVYRRRRGSKTSRCQPRDCELYVDYASDGVQSAPAASRAVKMGRRWEKWYLDYCVNEDFGLFVYVWIDWIYGNGNMFQACFSEGIFVACLMGVIFGDSVDFFGWCRVVQKVEDAMGLGQVVGRHLYLSFNVFSNKIKCAHKRNKQTNNTWWYSVSLII